MTYPYVTFCPEVYAIPVLHVAIPAQPPVVVGDVELLVPDIVELEDVDGLLLELLVVVVLMLVEVAVVELLVELLLLVVGLVDEEADEDPEPSSEHTLTVYRNQQANFLNDAVSVWLTCAPFTIGIIVGGRRSVEFGLRHVKVSKNSLIATHRALPARYNYMIIAQC